MSKWNSIIHYRPGRLGKSTILSSIGLGIRAIVQAAYLLLISRWLGADGYGLFAGIVAFFSFATPLANWGSGLLLTQYIAQDKKNSRGMWATALVQSGVIGTLLLTFTLSIVVLFLPQKIAIWSLLLLAISELILLPASHAASSQCFALERGSAAALSVSLVPFGRLVMVLLAIISPWSATPELAASAHFLGTVIGFAIAFGLVTWIDGLPAWKRRLSLASATRQGTAYAVSSVAGTSYQEVDKIIMLQLLGASTVGSYTVAFRVASIFVLPLTALIGVFLPRLMAQYNEGRKNKHTFRMVTLTALGYAALASLGMLLTAPFLPWVFGAGYEDSLHYLQLMALWPIIFSLRQVLAAGLTAQKKQRWRSWIETVGLLLIAILNLALLPQFGAKAAIFALLVTETAVTLMMYICSRQHKIKAYDKG